MAANPGNGFMPPLVKLLALILFHLWLEATVGMSDLVELRRAAPHTDRQASEIGAAGRRGLHQLGPVHRHAKDVGLELHQEIVPRGAAVNPKLG